MPLNPLLQGSAFGPDDIAIITAAFESVCQQLGVRDRSDPLATVAAQAVFDAAKVGMADTNVLERRALMTLDTSQ